MTKTKERPTEKKEVSVPPRTNPQKIAVDFPQEGDVVASHRYTFRISTAFKAARAEVSVNGGPWQICRGAVGLWWHDLRNLAPGRYAVVARAHKMGGEVIPSSVRHFTVQTGSARALDSAPRRKEI